MEPSAPVPTATALPGPKPGIRTSEFWLASIAKLVGILMASGVLGTGTIAERIAGLAATLLATMGYSYTRALVKGAAPVLLAVLIATGSQACHTPEVRAAEQAGLNCTKLERASLWDAGIELIMATAKAGLHIGSPPDWSAIGQLVLNTGKVALVCVYAEWRRAMAAPDANPAQTDGATLAARAAPDPMLERMRQRFAGGGPIKTSHGDL